MRLFWIICITCMLCFLTFFSRAQTFTVEMDSTTWFGMSYTFVGNVTNQSGNNIFFGLTILPQTLPNDWGMAICTPNGCLPDTLQDTFTIAPSVSEDLWIEFYTNFFTGFGSADFVLVNLADSSQRFEKTLIADLKVIGIPSKQAEKPVLLYNYPNPFYNSTQINYRFSSGKGSLLITNMLGKTVKRFMLHDQAGQIQLDLALPPGTYFYSLWQDQKQLAQRKMILIR